LKERQVFKKQKQFIKLRQSLFLCLQMSELLFQKFDEKVKLTAEEKAQVKNFFQPKKLRKKQYLLQEGDPGKYLSFVEKGTLRSYTIDDKGLEHIIQFAFEGWWIGDQYSFLTGEPSHYNIDALEDCELLLLSKDAEEEMMEKMPKMERFFRILLQNNLIAMQRRIISSLSRTAEEKYQELIVSCPTIPQRVPQHMMASYLGITPETLSRIRKQISGRKASS
jgi:CRP-like cAMP-binding protein